ncbi:MAG: adenine phosphoribosyltransferase [Geodermatophilaceae bacterium]|nr:adenine phosphoribosyltransferase [Geodermatophilaceae bacterium]
MKRPGAAGQDLAQRVSGLIRDVPDFPRPGILFKDIMPMLADGPTLAAVVDHIVSVHRPAGFDIVAGIEARGFLLAAPIAYAAGCGVVAIRKAGKLPGRCLAASYDLEYGQGVLELQRAALPAGCRVLVVDDVLATGGTLAAAGALTESAGAVVAGMAVLVELSALAGRERLSSEVTTLLVG